MNIEISEEFQDQMGGYSPKIECCESQMAELGPFEFGHTRKILKNGQFTLPWLSTPKLVFKLSSHDSIEYLPYLWDMIRLWGCKANKINAAVPCSTFPMAREMTLTTFVIDKKRFNVVTKIRLKTAS